MITQIIRQEDNSEVIDRNDQMLVYNALPAYECLRRNNS